MVKSEIVSPWSLDEVCHVSLGSDRYPARIVEVKSERLVAIKMFSCERDFEAGEPFRIMKFSLRKGGSWIPQKVKRGSGIYLHKGYSMYLDPSF